MQVIFAVYTGVIWGVFPWVTHCFPSYVTVFYLLMPKINVQSEWVLNAFGVILRLG